MNPCRVGSRVACLLLVLAAACAAPTGSDDTGHGPGAPPWVDDAYAGLSRSLVMAGVASAPGVGLAAEDAARRSAMRRINEDVLSRVQGELTTISSQLADSEHGERWQQDMMERIRIESEGELPGAALGDRWVDAAHNELVVRVTVDRDLLVQLLVGPVETALVKAQGMLDGLHQLDTDPTHDLLVKLQAYDLVARTFTDAMRAQAAARSGAKVASPSAMRARDAYERSRAFLDRVSREVAELAPLMRVEKLAGDAQQGDPRESLDQPLVGRVTLEVDGQPRVMPGLPMRFRADVPGGNREPTLVRGASTTDADGVIRCDVRDLAAGPRGQGTVVLEVDVESLGPSRLSDALPRASFVYSVLTAGQTSVAVGVDVLYDGAVLSRPDLTALVAGHLTERGFRAVARPEVAALEGQALRQTLGEGFQYAIRGDVSSLYSSRDGTDHWFVARAHLEIVHLATGRVVQTLSPEAKKPSKEVSPTGASGAVIALQRDLLAALDESFVSGFGR